VFANNTIINDKLFNLIALAPPVRAVLLLHVAGVLGTVACNFTLQSCQSIDGRIQPEIYPSKPGGSEGSGGLFTISYREHFIIKNHVFFFIFFLGVRAQKLFTI
jgi:hypothetical protein